MADLLFGVPAATLAATETPKTHLGVLAPANHRVKLLGLMVGFDGVDATKGPGLIEVCNCTFATNPPGTNSTSVTPVKYDPSKPETVQSTAGKTWTTEPTVITVAENFLVPTCMGSAVIWRPFAVPITLPGGDGACIRVTLPAGVTCNVTLTMVCEE